MLGFTFQITANCTILLSNHNIPSVLVLKVVAKLLAVTPERLIQVKLADVHFNS